ncbi:MAG: NAD(P)-dependent oxidoreductase [Verrucomicrobia bacterium]|nr:NAD(P)-dependent oxidoreductase [Verrucomicrobiota bacterium]MDA1068962.1 NAD(P)-dependent oxidoreductase [Verrucomicrobiota bacterium]
MLSPNPSSTRIVGFGQVYLARLARGKALINNHANMAKESILITGVYGLVGSCIYRHLMEKSEQYDVYGMDCSRQPSERVHADEVADVPDSHFFLSDMSDIGVLEQAFQGMDALIHMAADPDDEAPWESTFKNNMEASYHLFEAAKRAGVRRVIYASSIQVSFGYFYNIEPYKSIREGHFDNVPDSFERITTSDPTWPVNLYGSSKVFGETLARVYSSTTDLSCICIRMGGVHSMDKVPQPVLPNASTKNDMVRLVENCIQAPGAIKFEIVYGLSNSDYRWVDIKHAAKAVGYVPEDRIRLED